jgi:hypothetical protein
VGGEGLNGVHDDSDVLVIERAASLVVAEVWASSWTSEVDGSFHW